MSVIADIAPAVADDRVAKRNALVLAVAQALAGGNNTVIAATAGIVGTMLASDPGLATLPVSVMVCGIWLGTIPQGYLARNYGRRFALQTGSVIASGPCAELKLNPRVQEAYLGRIAASAVS